MQVCTYQFRKGNVEFWKQHSNTFLFYAGLVRHNLVGRGQKWKVCVTNPISKNSPKTMKPPRATQRKFAFKLSCSAKTK